MGTVNTTKIITNKLGATKSGSTNISAAKGVYTYDNGKFIRVKEIYASRIPSSEVLSDNIVWREFPYYLTTSQDVYYMEAVGDKVSNIIDVDSYYEDAKGNKVEAAYTFDVTNISENTTTQKKTHNITITQTSTGLKLNVQIIQEANEQLNVTYGTPTSTNVETEVIPASGGSGGLYVSYSQVKTTNYSNGTSKDETIYGTAPATIVNGTVNVSGATANGSYVSIGSAKDTAYTNDRTVYTVKSYSFTANGKSKTVSNVNIAVKQEANIASYSNWTYALNASTTDGTSFDAAPQYITVVVTSTRTRTATYTSGYDPNNNNNRTTENYSWDASITNSSTNEVTSSGSATTTICDVYLGPNTSTSSSRTSTLTISSRGDSSKKKTFTFTQTKDAVLTSTTKVYAYDASAEEAIAGGQTVDINMRVRVVSTPVYVSGNTGTATTSYKSATVKSFVGSAQNSSGATKNSEGTGVVVKSASNTERLNSWIVYKVTSVSGTYNGSSYTWSGTLNVYQEPNIRDEIAGDYTVTAATGTTSISALGRTFSVTAKATRKYTISYTSGYSTTEDRNAGASVTTTVGTVSQSSFTGSATFSVTVPENLGSARTVKITVTAGSVSKSVSVPQDAAYYSFSVNSDEIDCNATANTVNIVVTSTRNGKELSIVKSNVALSPTGIGTIGTITLSGSNYTIPIAMAANTGVERSLTVTITQPGSNNKKTVIINQASGIVRKTAGVVISECTYTNESKTKMNYNFKVTAKDTNKYLGGNVGSVRVGLNTSINGTGTNVAGPTTVASNLTVSAGTESIAYTGTFNIPSSYAGNVYFMVWLNNVLSANTDIEEMITDDFT